MKPRPKLVLLENVAGLYVQHRDVLKEIARILRELGYDVRIWLLNALDSGIPHNRTRLWIVAVRADSMVAVPKAPKALGWLPHLRHGFVDLRASVPEATLNAGGKRNVDHVRLQVAQVADLSTDSDHPILLDVHASKDYENWSVDRCPCLTRSRAKVGGFYVLQRRSMLQLGEMAALMGVRAEVLDKMRGAGVPEKSIAQAIGNAQAINVLERVLGNEKMRCNSRTLFAKFTAASCPKSSL